MTHQRLVSHIQINKFTKNVLLLSHDSSKTSLTNINSLTKKSFMTRQRLVSQIQIHYHNYVNSALTSYSQWSQLTSLLIKPKQNKTKQKKKVTNSRNTQTHVTSPHKKPQLHITQYKATNQFVTQHASDQSIKPKKPQSQTQQFINK